MTSLLSVLSANRPLSLESINIIRREVLSYTVESKGVAEVIALFGCISRHLGHDNWLHLDDRDLLGAAAPVSYADLVWPWMPAACGLQDCREFGGLGRIQWDGAADDLQITAAIAPADDDLGSLDAAGHGTDDHLDRVPVLDLSAGSLGRRALSC